jgi:hypothetical protein
MPSILNSDDGVVSGTSGLKTTGGNDGITTFQQNGTEAARITATGNVGIGTSSPDGRLHVMTSSAGAVTADADADDLTIEGATNPGISILGTGDDVCSIYFGNPGSNGQKDGGIRYFQESFATVADRRSMTFITGTLERARIDSSGNFQFNSGYGSVATAYGCRAWVNFNGTGTVAIREDGNVSSITDNGTGDYTVNFTTAMPDANYAAVAGIVGNTSSGLWVSISSTTSAFRVNIITTGGTNTDRDTLSVAIFR